MEDFYNAMKLKGFQFPVLKEADAMFDVEEAPQWVDDSESTNCYRCRVDFSTLRRRHHCRACGQIFCHACSSKQAAIPKYGIEKEVRVCDVCFDKLNSNVPLPNESDLPLEYLNSALYREAKASQETAASKGSAAASAAGIKPTVAAAAKSNEKTEEEFQEELQLALALSQSEIEAKKESSKSKKSSSKSKGHSKSASSRNENSNSSTSLYANESASNATAPYFDSSANPQASKQYKVLENGNYFYWISMWNI